MKSDKFKYTRKDNKLEVDIYMEKTKKSAFIFFVTVGTIILSMPFVIFILSLVEKFDLGFGFIFSILVAALVSFYLFRMAFWNMYGVEKYYITKDSVTFIADYRIFKDTVMTIEGVEIIVGYFDERNSSDENLTTAKLIFSTDKNQIQSTIDLSIDDIYKIIKVIDKAKFLSWEKYK